MRKITIGADPEFVLIAKNKPLSAREVCNDWGNHNHFGREIGQDGLVFELRPDPSTDVFAVVANIRKILRIHIQKHPYLKKCIFTGGHAVETQDRAFAIGGHIHMDTKAEDAVGMLEDNKFQHFLNKIIYNGFMSIINDKKNHAIRKHIGYGKANDFRNKGNGTIQYKTPPSWLVSPTLAFIFLALAKICGLLYINKQAWKTTTSINDIIEGKDKGLILLKRLSAIVQTEREMMQEEDIVKCLEIIDNLPQRHKSLSWQRDFKQAWRL